MSIERIILDENYIINEYNSGRSGLDLARELGCSKQTIYKRLLKNNIILRPPRNNTYTNFFSEDSLEMAWAIGWIYGDGNIIYNKERGDYKITLELSEKDVYIVEMFKKMIPQGHIYRRDNRVRWVLHSKKDCEELIEMGLYPNKTKTILPLYFKNKKMQKSFWQGVWEADGSCFRNKYNTCSISLAGNKNTCNGFKNFLKWNTKISIKPEGSFVCRKNYKNTQGFLRDIFNKENIDSGRFLERKYLILLEFLK